MCGAELTGYVCRCAPLCKHSGDRSVTHTPCTMDREAIAARRAAKLEEIASLDEMEKKVAEEEAIAEKRRKVRMQAALISRALATREKEIKHAEAEARAKQRQEEMDRITRIQNAKTAAATHTPVSLEIQLGIDLLESLQHGGDARLMEWYEEWRAAKFYGDADPHNLTAPLIKMLKSKRETSLTAVASARALSIAMLTEAPGVSKEDAEAIACSGALLRTADYLAKFGGAHMTVYLTPAAYTFGINSTITGYSVLFTPSVTSAPMTVCIPSLEFAPDKPSGFLANKPGSVEGVVSTVPCTVALYPLHEGSGAEATLEAACATVGSAPGGMAYSGYAVQLVRDTSSSGGGALFLCVASAALGSLTARRDWVGRLNAARAAGEGNITVSVTKQPIPPAPGADHAQIQDMPDMVGRNVRAAVDRSHALAAAVAAAMGKALPATHEESYITVGNTWARGKGAEDHAVFFSGCCAADVRSKHLVAWGGPALGPLVAVPTGEMEPTFEEVPRVTAFPMYVNAARSIADHAPELVEDAGELPHKPDGGAGGVIADSDSDDEDLTASGVRGLQRAKAHCPSGVKAVSCGADFRPSAVTASLLLGKKTSSYAHAKRALRSQGFAVQDDGRQAFVPLQDTVVFA